MGPGGGFRRRLYENSLLFVMGAIWIGTWLAQSVTGVTEYNSEQLDHHEQTVSWLEYLGPANFWEKTLQPSRTGSRNSSPSDRW